MAVFDRPMMPFITNDLCDILHSLIIRFIKDTVLAEADKAYKLANVDAADESKWKYIIDKVDPGFAAKRVLDQTLKCKVISPLTKKDFLAACRNLYSAMTQKI